MARKDLSRTVIEGGRYFHNSYFRGASHGTARARTLTAGEVRRLLALPYTLRKAFVFHIGVCSVQ